MSDPDLPEEKPSYCSDYVSRNRVASADPFEDALQVVINSKHASELAIKAQHEADVITEMAKKAQARALALSRISANLCSTASTVAVTALRVCGYADFDTAYEANPDYMNTLSLEALNRILHTADDVVALQGESQVGPLPHRNLDPAADIHSQGTSTASLSPRQSRGISMTSPIAIKPRANQLSPSRIKLPRRGECFIIWFGSEHR